MTDEQKPQEKAQPAPDRWTVTEAPVSVNAEVYTAHGYRLMITRRGINGETLKEMLQLLDYLSTQGCSPTRNAQAPNPIPAAIVPAAPAPLAPAAPQPPTPPAAPPSDAQFVTTADRLEIATTKKGNPQLRFNTPEGIITCALPLDALLSRMPAGWTAQHIAPGTTYNHQFKVTYTVSPAGYKNVSLVTYA